MKTISTLILRELRGTDLEQAVQILGRSMCDNPVNVRVFAQLDAERRCWALARFFRPVLRGLYQRGLIYGAYRDGVLVGVCGIARPGFCQHPVFRAPLPALPHLRRPRPADLVLRLEFPLPERLKARHG